jgi:hypothetical protein
VLALTDFEFDSLLPILSSRTPTTALVFTSKMRLSYQNLTEFDSMEHVRDSTRNLQLLSELLLTVPVATKVGTRCGAIETYSSGTREVVRGIVPRDVDDLKALAITNHVIMRSFRPLQQLLEADGNDAAELVAAAVQEETARIHHALGFLEQICTAVEEAGCPVIVIKSLDHWPDLGSDLDLYTDADAVKVVELMSVRFKATLADRSWGDRLARKWNFVVPGLPELVEVHAGRLGQTGEQTAATKSLSLRSHMAEVHGHVFRVAAPEDRIIISTLQRMYRHFYIRLCDIVDNARLLDSHLIDFAHLHSVGRAAGLWEGIATYLMIISEYVEAYRGQGVPLPSLVNGSAKFGTGQVRFHRDFLRISILPHSLNLYASELMTLLLNGELRNSLRLSLLPGLATAAALEQKITGSDKGIW